MKGGVCGLLAVDLLGAWLAGIDAGDELEAAVYVEELAVS